MKQHLRIFFTTIFIFLFALGLSINAQNNHNNNRNLSLQNLMNDSSREELRLLLLNSVNKDQYPNGLIEFLSPRMETSENLSSVEFAIVRKGNVNNVAKVTFKAIDISTKYGDDYFIEVKTDIGFEKMIQHVDAKSLIDAAKSGIYLKEKDATERADLVSRKNEKLEEKSVKGLRAARQAFTGEKQSRVSWKDAGSKEKEAVKAKNAELYEGLPGITYDFIFQPGECLKIVRFNTIDDVLSEDDEQVMFALLNPENVALADSPTGLMNIKDNDAYEASSFKILEQEIVAENGTEKVEFTIERSGAIQRYGVVDVGTETVNAVANYDYEPLRQEITFLPGQTQQKIYIPINHNNKNSDKKFKVKINNQEQSSATVIINKYDEDAAIKKLNTPAKTSRSGSEKAVPTLQDNSDKTRAIDGYEKINDIVYKVKELKYSDITSTNRYKDGKLYVDYIGQFAYATYEKLDLSMIKFIKFSWRNWDCTTYWRKNKKTSGYHYGEVSAFKIGEKTKQEKLNSTFEGADTIVELDDDDRTKKSVQMFTGVWNSNKISRLEHSDPIKLYYQPIEIYLRTNHNDADANIEIKTWNSPTNVDKKTTNLFVGSFKFVGFENDVDKKLFYDNDTVTLEPAFVNGITDDIKEKIYLWGYKIERIGGLNGDKYHYVKSNQIKIKDLYQNKLKDVNGTQIKKENCMFDSNGGKMTFSIFPVFKAKTAWVRIDIDKEKGEIENFESGDFFKIGMLDSVNIRGIAKTGFFVTGWNTNAWNHCFLSMTTDADERSTISGYTEQQVQNGLKKHTDKIQNTYKRDISDMINSALPNELIFKPNTNYSYIQAVFVEPKLTVMVDRQSGKILSDGSIEYFNDGSIAYISEKKAVVEGEVEVDVDVVKGNKDSSIVITPTESNKIYKFIGTQNDDLRILWKDWSGDINQNGILDEEEKQDISKYETLFNRIATVGNFYNYLPQYYNCLLLYSFEPKPIGRAKGTVSGKIQMSGRTVLQNSSEDSTKDEIENLYNATVSINGHSVATDIEGKFSIQHEDFRSSENYNLIINYKGKNYTGFINVNNHQTITLQEYDDFLPYDFDAYIKEENDNSRKIDLKKEDVKNKDTDLLFTFAVKSLKPNLLAKKAKIKIYTKEHILRKEYDAIYNTLTLKFEVKFNPYQDEIIHGDYLKLQIFDQNYAQYTEHKVGITFTKYMDTFNLLNSFKCPVVNEALDVIGAIDCVFDLGLAGKADDHLKQDGDIQTIEFGFSKAFSGDLYNSDEKAKENAKNAKIEKLKNAATSLSKDEDGANKDAKDAIDDFLAKDDPKNKKKGKVVSDYELTLSTSLYLSMARNNANENFYFKELIISASMSGKVSASVSYMTPIGINLIAGISFSGEVGGAMVIEQYGNKKSYFDENGEIDFSKAGVSNPDRNFTIYGKFFVNPHIDISIGAEFFIKSIKAELSGRADFKMNFTTSGSGSGSVTFSATLGIQILFFEKTWKLADKTIEMFDLNNNNGVSKSMRSLIEDGNFLYDSIEENEIVSRNYLKNRKKWNGKASKMRTVDSENEQVILDGVYPYPFSQIWDIGNDEQLLVFLDDNEGHNDYNRTELFYSIYQNAEWSQPQLVDDDGTNDDSPIIYGTDDKIIVAWSSADAIFTEQTTPLKMMSSRNIKTRFFDKTTKQFEEIAFVTKSTELDVTGDDMPSIAYWKNPETKIENMMITYTKSEYTKDVRTDELVGDLLHPYTTIAYRFYDFQNKKWNDSYTPKALEKLTRNSNYNPEQVINFQENFYGQGFIDLSKYVEVNEENILIKGSGEEPGEFIQNVGLWSREPEKSEIIIKKDNTDPKILEAMSTGYSDFAISAYIVDMDKDLNTVNDKEIFLQFYDFVDDYFYPAIRLTNDTKNYSYINFSQTPDGLSMFYLADGDIVELDIVTFWNEGLLGYDIDGEYALVIDKTPKGYRPSHTIVTKKDSENPICEFIPNADEDHVYITWTEKQLTYKDGILANSADAADPKNQLEESQIYVAVKFYGEEKQSILYDEDRKILTYPKNDDSDKPIDYGVTPDFNGNIGVVNAGDQMSVNFRETYWTSPVAMTEEKGANYSDIDFEMLSNNRLRGVYVKGMSETLTIDGNEYARENKDKRKLATMDFILNKPKFSVKIDTISEVIEGNVTTINLAVKNEAIMIVENLELELLINGETNSSKIIKSIIGGKIENVFFDYQQPEELVPTTIKIVVKQNEKIVNEIEQDLLIESKVDVDEATYSIVNRENLSVSSTITNRGNIAGKDKRLFISYGDTFAQSDSFNIGVGETKTINLDFKITDYSFKATKNDDGSIVEKLDLMIYSNGAEKLLKIERNATANELAIIDNIAELKLIDGENNELGGDFSYLKNSVFDINVLAKYKNAEDAIKPDLVLVSETPEIFEVYGNHIVKTGSGVGKLVAYVVPPRSKIIALKDSYVFDFDLNSIAKDAIMKLSANINFGADLVTALEEPINWLEGKNPAQVNEDAKSGITIDVSNKLTHYSSEKNIIKRKFILKAVTLTEMNCGEISVIGNKIKYIPATDFNTQNRSPVEFSYTVEIEENSRNYDFTFTGFIKVNPINDTPKISFAEKTLLATGNSVISIPGFAKISAGAENEETQDLDILVTTTSKSFTVKPEISRDGTLIFTPKNVTKNSTATIYVAITDDENCGGKPLTTKSKFNILLTSGQISNSAPSFEFVNKNETSIVENENKGTWKGNFNSITRKFSKQILKDIIPYQKNVDATIKNTEKSQKVSFIVTTDSSKFSKQPRISNKGILDFTLAADVNGLIELNVSATDNALPIVFSENKTFTINVTKVNNPPEVKSFKIFGTNEIGENISTSMINDLKKISIALEVTDKDPEDIHEITYKWICRGNEGSDAEFILPDDLIIGEIVTLKAIIKDNSENSKNNTTLWEKSIFLGNPEWFPAIDVSHIYGVDFGGTYEIILKNEKTNTKIVTTVNNNRPFVKVFEYINAKAKGLTPNSEIEIIKFSKFNPNKKKYEVIPLTKLIITNFLTTNYENPRLALNFENAITIDDENQIINCPIELQNISGFAYELFLNNKRIAHSTIFATDADFTTNSKYDNVKTYYTYNFAYNLAAKGKYQLKVKPINPLLTSKSMISTKWINLESYKNPTEKSEFSDDNKSNMFPQNKNLLGATATLPSAKYPVKFHWAVIPNVDSYTITIQTINGKMILSPKNLGKLNYYQHLLSEGEYQWEIMTTTKVKNKKGKIINEKSKYFEVGKFSVTPLSGIVNRLGKLRNDNVSTNYDSKDKVLTIINNALNDDETWDFYLYNKDMTIVNLYENQPAKVILENIENENYFIMACRSKNDNSGEWSDEIIVD